MAETTRLKLPLLSASQAQKHVTHNEAITMLDMLSGVIAVVDRSLTVPAGGESDGQAFILGGAGTGAWSGYAANDLALRLDGGWRRVLPSQGMVAAIADEDGLLVHWSGSAWLPIVTFYAASPSLAPITKADPYSVAFAKTGAGTIDIKAGSSVEVAGQIVNFAAATAVAMPALIAGTDYAIWIKPDGTLEATTNFTSPPIANSRKIGGFHYAPGGNAPAQAGGDSTPAINEYSLWDLKFRPTCPDPRGMRKDPLGWATIYGLGVDHIVNGPSRYNVTLADGSSPPKIPLSAGGNGTTAYTTFNWWEAAEVMASHGLRLPTMQEFEVMGYGTTEASSAGTDPVSTILRAAYTSKWGDMSITGNMWWWGANFGGPYGTAAWTANGRGSTYNLSDVVLLGGSWGDGAASGSRASLWSALPSYSGDGIGARGRCDHLNHV